MAIRYVVMVEGHGALGNYWDKASAEEVAREIRGENPHLIVEIHERDQERAGRPGAVKVNRVKSLRQKYGKSFGVCENDPSVPFSEKRKAVTEAYRRGFRDGSNSGRPGSRRASQNPYNRESQPDQHVAWYSGWDDAEEGNPPQA